MGRIAGVQQFEAAAIEVHAVEVREVGVFAGFAAVCREVHHPEFFVHPRDRPRDELPGRDLVLQRAGSIEQVVVPPPVAL